MKTKEQIENEFDRLGKLHMTKSKAAHELISSPKFEEALSQLHKIAGARELLLWVLYKEKKEVSL